MFKSQEEILLGIFLRQNQFRFGQEVLIFPFKTVSFFAILKRNQDLKQKRRAGMLHPSGAA